MKFVMFVFFRYIFDIIQLSRNVWMIHLEDI